MARPTRERIDDRPVLPQRTDMVNARAVARPVDTTITPAGDPEMEGLIRGLAVLEPKLQRYIETKDDADDDEGFAARARGEKADSSKSASWHRGYMRMDGTARGLQDREAVRQRYETEFDKDAATPQELEAFFTKVSGDLTKGVDDKAFLDGYNNAITPELLKLRAEFGEHHRQRVVQKRDANAQFLLETGIREFTSKGVPIDDAFISRARTQLAEQGVTGKDFNALLFNAVKRIGDEGNSAVYDFFKKDRPDGTKGMYFIPEWKAKIDAAQIHAQNVFLANRDRAYRLAEQERAEKQDTALYEVFNQLFSGDAAGARTRFDQLRASGLFNRASDLAKWETLFSSASNREASGEQLTLQNELLTRVYTGQAGPRQILDAALTPGQKRQVLAEWRTVQHQNRQLATQAAANGRAIFQTPEFKSGYDFIEKFLVTGPDPGDVYGVGSEFVRQQRATALLEFTTRVRDITNPAEIHTIREDVAQRYSKRIKDWTAEQKGMPRAGRTQYATPMELEAARRAGGVPDGEYAAWQAHFRRILQQQQQPK